MTSQKWLTENGGTGAKLRTPTALIPLLNLPPPKDTDCPFWTHFIAVIVPDVVKYKDRATMVIDGMNDGQIPQIDTELVLLCEAIALTTLAPCGVSQFLQTCKPH